ncbi:zinc metalloprotease HtpX [Legionella sp.]|uniref:zinc metalloprotease HtpX n=1 Tax=Legionella sp. TaxID=459 RepID=UPI003CBCB1F7
MSLVDYHGGAGNWREQIKKNQRKTRMVIALFIIVYFAVGFFADIFVLQTMHPQSTLQQDVYALVNLRVIPYATLLMVGLAVVSLLITYSLYDRIMLLGTEYHEITPQTVQNVQEQQLYNVVEEMTVAAGLSYVPKVFIIEADYMNAFASGYSEKSAMVAITRGLINKLDRAELQAVMAHELSHIRHYDIKLTLTVAVLSNILLIVVDVLFYSVLFRRDNRRDDNRLLMVIMILRYVLPLLTVLLTLFLSRTREYMADAGCVELMRNNEPLARALVKINADHAQHAEYYSAEYGNTPHEQVRRASYLFDSSDIDPVKSLSSAFDTHPSIKQRLNALGFRPK